MCQLSVTPPPVVGVGSDDVNQPVRPLRSALRSTDSKLARNDLHSKPEMNQSASPASDRRGQKQVDDAPAASDSSGLGDGTAAADARGGGTTLQDLKRQRARWRGTTNSAPGASPPAVKSSTPSSGVGNGDLSSGDHEPRLRLTSPEYVTVDEKREQRRCCVII